MLRSMIQYEGTKEGEQRARMHALLMTHDEHVGTAFRSGHQSGQTMTQGVW